MRDRRPVAAILAFLFVWALACDRQDSTLIAPTPIAPDSGSTLEYREQRATTLVWSPVPGAATNEIAQAHGTKFSFDPFYASNPTLTDPPMREVIARAASSLGFKTKVLPSGAGHDAQEAARVGPMGMIFIPSIGGISHSPKEFSRPEDIVNGANVLLQTVLALDEKPITSTR